MGLESTHIPHIIRFFDSIIIGRQGANCCDISNSLENMKLVLAWEQGAAYFQGPFKFGRAGLHGNAEMRHGEKLAVVKW